MFMQAVSHCALNSDSGQSKLPVSHKKTAPAGFLWNKNITQTLPDKQTPTQKAVRQTRALSQCYCQKQDQLRDQARNVVKNLLPQEYWEQKPTTAPEYLELESHV